MDANQKRVADMQQTLARTDREVRTINMMRASLMKGQELDKDTMGLTRGQRRALKAMQRKGKANG